MFEFKLKRNGDGMESCMDLLMEGRSLIINDRKKPKEIGMLAKELRDKKLLHQSYDYKNGESIVYLKINNFVKPDSVVKTRKRGKPVYVFKDTLIPFFRL